MVCNSSGIYMCPQLVTDLEDEIERLEGAAKTSNADPDKLAELKAELEKINRKKAEYVAEHPEQRRLVYRPRRKEGEKEEEIVLPTRRLFRKNGLPRHPERSIYYDPVMNKFGVAPPGMPYMERREFSPAICLRELTSPKLQLFYQVKLTAMKRWKTVYLQIPCFHKSSPFVQTRMTFQCQKAFHQGQN